MTNDYFQNVHINCQLQHNTPKLLTALCKIMFRTNTLLVEEKVMYGGVCASEKVQLSWWTGKLVPFAK